MFMQLHLNDFLVSEVTEDLVVTINDMPEGWYDSIGSLH
jgi:hypothetical protein